MSRLFPIYLVSFLFAYQAALPLYINSSFLGKFLPESSIGFLYSVSSIVTILFLVYLSKVLSKFGNYKTLITIIGLNILFLPLLALSLPKTILLLIFIGTQICMALIAFMIDIVLEEFSKNKTTGKIRGIYLTISN